MTTTDPPPIPVVVEVDREVCGRSARLGTARVVEGDPHVLKFFDPAPLGKLTALLAVDGYTFTVRLADRQISLLEWFCGEDAPGLDCRACSGDGRRWDGARFVGDACPACGGGGLAATD